MSALTILLGLIVILVVIGLAESIIHRRNLSRIPIRIHVNGTRGKSSVTRLIAAGLRGAGIRTFAKTTGTLPRMILPDGSEVPVNRKAKANVLEQRDIVQHATRYESQAIVLECMALQPWLQWICESKLVRATHGVITNAWPDHLDVMGPDDRHVAAALANMTPQQGILLTAEKTHRRILRRAAKDRGSQFIAVGAPDFDRVTDEELARFRYPEHRENVALALRVCQELGIEREEALAGMCQAQPDPGATSTYELEFWGRQIHFISAFAANDPTSTERIWETALVDYPQTERRIALFNCRSDRADRSRQLAQACAEWTPADYYVLVGTGTHMFVRYASAAGVDPRNIIVAEQEDLSGLFETLIDLGGASAVIVGMGNIGDNGLEIARFFRNRSTLISKTVTVHHPMVHERAEAENAREPELQPVGAGDFGLASSSNGKH